MIAWWNRRIASGTSWTAIATAAAALTMAVILPSTTSAAQDRAGPDGPRIGLSDDFEADDNQDGLPDGWFNSRDHELVATGGALGPKFFRFRTDKPGRPSKAHRGVPIPGEAVEAVIVGVWSRLENVRLGEKHGELPAAAIDFLGEGMTQPGRAWMETKPPSAESDPDPAPRSNANLHGWTYQAKRFPVPRGTVEGILSIGLMGATGTADFDGLSLEFIPRGGAATPNLVRNGGFEIGNHDPQSWALENRARRVHPGHQSASAIELSESRSLAASGLGILVDRASELEISVWAKGNALRSRGGAGLQCFFLNRDGKPIRDAEPALLHWSGTFDWERFVKTIPVPGGAHRAVLQFEKLDSYGTIRIDDVMVRTAPNPIDGEWVPDHVIDNVNGWLPYVPAPAIAPGSALDFSFLVPKASVDRRVSARQGHLVRDDGSRAKFFGVGIMPPLHIPNEPERSQSLADRLAKSGVNLVRLMDIDAPYGMGRSLIDAGQDDSRALDPDALGRFEETIAALRERGIALALDLQSQRRFRDGDGLNGHQDLPFGGGPASAFDPKIQSLALEFMGSLLGHRNAKTGKALQDDPALIWVALAAEHSLFDLKESPDAALKKAAGGASKAWRTAESASWTRMARQAREAGYKGLLAGSSHWRREPEFAQAQTADGLDLIDDRLYFSASRWSEPSRRALVWGDEPTAGVMAAKKRRPDHPYIAGLWARQTQEAWASPYSGSDLILLSLLAAREDWDGLVTRGVFWFPESWGGSPPGTTGGLDTVFVSNAINAQPQIFSLLPHASSLFLRGGKSLQAAKADRDRPSARPSSPSSSALPGWQPNDGWLTIDTPYTQGAAGWLRRREVRAADFQFSVSNPYAVVMASSATAEPIASSKRILVTAIGQVAMTGMRWSDCWRWDVGDPGQGPLRIEPIQARVAWKRSGPGVVKAYVLDSSGNRVGEAPLETIENGVSLRLSHDETAALHWELTVETPK